jgi:hemoglobin
MAERTIFVQVGGRPGFERLTARFYDKVKNDPLLAPVFATFTPSHATNVAIWLAEVFGGPKEYSEARGGHRRVLEKHKGLALTEAHRRRWVDLMIATARDVLPADDALQQRLADYFEWGSQIAVAASQPVFEIDRVGPVPNWDWRDDTADPSS